MDTLHPAVKSVWYTEIKHFSWCTLIEWNLYRVCFLLTIKLTLVYALIKAARLSVTYRLMGSAHAIQILIIQALRKIQSKQHFGHFQNDTTELVLLDIKWKHYTVAKCLHAAHSWWRHAYVKHYASQKSTGERVSVCMLYKNKALEAVWTCMCRMRRWRQSSPSQNTHRRAIHWCSE